MRELKGQYTSALIFSSSAENYSLAQIQQLIDNPVLAGSKVRVMPDVHPGKIGPVGFTATVTDKIMPGIVGVDIGCGITMAKIKTNKVQFQKLDSVIREDVPSGFQIRRERHRYSEKFDFSRLHCVGHINQEKAEKSLGTLGGGNHFIELDKDKEGNLFVVIHTGSRHLGKEVAEYYMRVGQNAMKTAEKAVPYEFSWLDGEPMQDYIHDASIVREFAALNRETILDVLCKGMKWKVTEWFSCVHNYIDMDGQDSIIRKGAISAKSGEPVIIPINMRDGIILGTGKGNTEWNESAPHGAGRIMNRSTVKQKFTVSMFRKAMDGIYSPSIGKDTLDEAPFAYRGIDEIEKAVSETVAVEKILKPIYNFKAGGED